MPVERNPWTFRGQPESGGRLAPRHAESERHPTHRGRLYVVGHGWLWLAGWAQADGTIRLAADPMTEAHVDQYCQPSSPAESADRDGQRDGVRHPGPASGSGRDAGPANQARVLAPRQATLGELMSPADRAQLAGTAPSRDRPHAREPARAGTPPGAPSGAHPESHVSHTVPASPNRDFLDGGESAKTARRVEVAKSGRNRPDSKPSAEATAQGMEELNDDIPF